MSKSQKNSGKLLVGQVVKNSMDKSIVVEVKYSVKHRVGKYVTRHTKIHAHDEANICKIGDLVKIKETRPISKMKSWTLLEVLSN